VIVAIIGAGGVPRQDRTRLLPWYIATETPSADEMARTSSSPRSPRPARDEPIPVERIQTGVRIEKRLLKVLKALAEYKDVSLGDLIEGIVLHSFEGKAPFSKETLAMIAKFKEIYGLELGAEASHRMSDRRGA
jgi:hypothetical protein